MKDLVLGYSPYGNGNSIFPFDDVFSHKQDILHQGIEGIDALVLWGGTDIHPSYYGETHHSRSQAFMNPPSRDVLEWKAMVYCKLHNIPMIGVCRGAQFMCAFAGGKLIQDVTGHAQGGSHDVITNDGQVFSTTSAHHQMMYPFDVPHEMLAWSKTKRSAHYQNGDDAPIASMFDKVEPEVVFFPKIRALCIQGHPEWMTKKDPLVGWFNELIVDKLLNKVVA